MINFLRFIKLRLPYLILLMMVLGIVIGYFNQVSFLKSLVTPTLFLMIYPMMINLKISDLFRGFSNPKPIIISVLINFIISPALGLILGMIFFKDYPMLMVGLLLISLIPTSGMTASWTGLAKGNMKSALLMISINLLISIFMIPFYMKMFLNTSLPIDIVEIILSLLKVVIIPLILGDITRRAIIHFSSEVTFKKFQPNLSSISSIGVLIIVFIAMALKSKTIINESGLVIFTVIPLVLYYGVLLFLSNLIGNKFLDYENKVSLVYGTTMRNLTIALGLSISSFDQSLAVFIIAIGYIIQVPMAAFYMKFVTKKN